MNDRTHIFQQVLAYMAAYTSITLNFMQENYSLLYIGQTMDGLYYKSCKSLWWDYVTETGELVILIFGIHLSYASRNARTQFHVSNFRNYSLHHIVKLLTAHTN